MTAQEWARRVPLPAGSLYERLTLLGLSQSLDADPPGWPTLKTLSHQSGLAEVKLRAALDRLVSLGLIRGLGQQCPTCQHNLQPALAIDDSHLPTCSTCGPPATSTS